GALVLAHEVKEGGRVRLPVLREPLEVLKYRGYTGRAEERYRILGVLVEVRVEDALVHEVRIALDREQYPAQVMQLQHGQGVRLAGDGCFDLPRVFIEDLFAPWNDLREDRKAVARRGPGVDRAVSSLLHLIGEDPPLRDRH